MLYFEVLYLLYDFIVAVGEALAAVKAVYLFQTP